MISLNLFKSMRLREEASRAEDWEAEFHYGFLAIAQGMGWGAIIGGVVVAIIIFGGFLQ